MGSLISNYIIMSTQQNSDSPYPSLLHWSILTTLIFLVSAAGQSYVQDPSLENAIEWWSALNVALLFVEILLSYVLPASWKGRVDRVLAFCLFTMGLCIHSIAYANTLPVPESAHLPTAVPPIWIPIPLFEITSHPNATINNNANLDMVFTKKNRAMSGTFKHIPPHQDLWLTAQPDGRSDCYLLGPNAILNKAEKTWHMPNLAIPDSWENGQIFSLSIWATTPAETLKLEDILSTRPLSPTIPCAEINESVALKTIQVELGAAE